MVHPTRLNALHVDKVLSWNEAKCPIALKKKQSQGFGNTSISDICQSLTYTYAFSDFFACLYYYDIVDTYILVYTVEGVFYKVQSYNLLIHK